MNHDSCERLSEDNLHVLFATKDCCMTCATLALCLKQCGASFAIKCSEPHSWICFCDIISRFLDMNQFGFCMSNGVGDRRSLLLPTFKSGVFRNWPQQTRVAKNTSEQETSYALQLTGKHLAHCEPIQKPDLIRIKTISAQFKRQTSICFGVKYL